MDKAFARSEFTIIASFFAILISGQQIGFAQSSSNMGGSPTNGVSTQQLNTAFASLQQLLQSGILNADQTQRANTLLAAVQNALAGGSLNAAQVRQIGQAIAAARKARQSGNNTGTAFDAVIHTAGEQLQSP